MSEITVIGLGLMGAALARALHAANVGLTVWNRSPEKARPFVERGVATAADAASAVAESSILVICIDNYTNTASILDSTEVRPLLPGRIVVQFTSGTPKDARELAAAVQAAGAFYLDGKLLCGPADIGTGQACVRLAGDRSEYERTSAFWQHLDSRARYLGENISAAAAIDLAWLMTRYGNFIAMAHAARICQSESADLHELLDVFPVGSATHRYLEVLESGRFGEYTASLAVWGAELKHIREQGAVAGIDTRVPDLIAGFFNKAIRAGYGDENVMALVKVLDD